MILMRYLFFIFFASLVFFSLLTLAIENRVVPTVQAEVKKEVQTKNGVYTVVFESQAGRIRAYFPEGIAVGIPCLGLSKRARVGQLSSRRRKT